MQENSPTYEMDDAASSSSTSHQTSPAAGRKSYVSSAQIQLRPKSVKSQTQDGKTATDIELTTLKNELKPTTKSVDRETEVTVTMRKKATSAGQSKPPSGNSVPSATNSLAAAATTASGGETSTFTFFSRSRKDRKKWNAVEEADSHKGFRTSFKRMMGCGSSLDAMYDDPMPVVVFGATGLVGGAVARALLRDRRFEVKAVTRTPTNDASRKLAEEGAIIVTADLNDPRSLTRALEGAHAVFLITHYWEHLNKEKEITQGKNCVEAAVSSGVGHFVLYGSESPADVMGGQCAFLDSRAAIEKYIRNTCECLDFGLFGEGRGGEAWCDVEWCGGVWFGTFLESKAAIEKYIRNTCKCLDFGLLGKERLALPYTVVRVPFYFENFLGVFKPHRVRSGIFAVALPMEDKALEMIGVGDVGRCVLRVLLRPKLYLCRVVPLAVERLTVQQITDTFNKHFTDRKFISPKIRVKDYESFGFDGSKDIAAMFEFYQHGGLEPRDPKLTRKVQVSHVTFDRWVAENKQSLAENMNLT
ncbi:hypothetical protein ACOMHN_005619 [Nucella lapillus]